MPFGALRPSGRIRGFKGLRTAACLIAMITALTGCGLLPFGNKDNSQSPVAPPPQSEITPQTEPQHLETIAIPPDGTVAVVDPSASPEGLEGYIQVPAPEPAPPPPPLDPVLAAGALQLGPDGTMGSLGLNVEEYFGEATELSDRITRVERVVSALQRDIRILAPPILRLITVEQDIQALVTQLTQLAQAPPPSRASPGAVPLYQPARAGSSGTPPASASPPPPAKVSSGGSQAPSASGPVTVDKLRLGEHADKTRIVFDVSGPATYRYDLDNAEKLLVVELPQAGWADATQGSPGKSPVLASYTVTPMDGGGSRVIMQLKKDTSVVYETVIKPNGYDDYRIVIDLKK